MNNASDYTKPLTALLKKLTKGAADEPQFEGGPVETLVHSFLMWESTRAKADKAYTSLMNQIVDWNDLRVSMPHELADAFGRDPFALERARRMRATLNDVFVREHDVTLDHLHEMGKRDLRRYLETLDGIPPYVAARVMLICFDTHAIPVDTKLRDRLINEQCADPEVTIDELSNWLTRQIKATDAVKTHLALQEWAQKSRRRTRSTSANRSSSRRSTSKKKKRSTRKTSKKKKTSRRKTASRR